LPTFSDVFSRFPQDFCALLAFVILKNFPLSRIEGTVEKKLSEQFQASLFGRVSKAASGQ
jgi:hypothetical protein